MPDSLVSNCNTTHMIQSCLTAWSATLTQRTGFSHACLSLVSKCNRQDSVKPDSLVSNCNMQHTGFSHACQSCQQLQHTGFIHACQSGQQLQHAGFSLVNTSLVPKVSLTAPPLHTYLLYLKGV